MKITTSPLIKLSHHCGLGAAKKKKTTKNYNTKTLPVVIKKKN